MPGISVYDPVLMPEMLATALSRYDNRAAVYLDDEPRFAIQHVHARTCARNHNL